MNTILRDSRPLRLSLSLFLATAIVILVPTAAWAKYGIPNWVTAPVLKTTDAIASVTVSAASGISEAVSLGGEAITGNISVATLEEITGLTSEELIASASAAGLCAGTAGIACAIGAASALGGFDGYELYQLFKDPPTVNPNADYPTTVVPTGPNYGWVPGASQTAKRFCGSWGMGTVAAQLPYFSGNQLQIPIAIGCAGGQLAMRISICATSSNSGCAIPIDGVPDFTANGSGLLTATVTQVNSSWMYTGTTPNTAVNHILLTLDDSNFNPVAPISFTPPPVIAPQPPNWNPTRQMVTTRTCKYADGTVQTVTASGSIYHEATNAEAIAAIPACPSGSTVASTNVVIHTPDGSAPDKTATTYTAPATGVSTAPVILYQVQPDGTLESCEQSVSPCADWFYDPSKTTDYVCKQGTVVLALQECDELANRYNPPVVNTGENGCFDGMGLSPLTWPKGLVISPLKCLFIPDSSVFASWQAQIDDINATGPVAALTTFRNFLGKIHLHSDGTCPTETVSTPIHWCDVISAAGDQTQNTTWGQTLYDIGKAAIVVYFLIYWYNRITSSTGGKGEI